MVDSSRSGLARNVQQGRGKSHHRIELVDAVADEGVWGSMKKAEAQALKKVVDLVSEAGEQSGNGIPGARLVIGMDPQRRMPKFESQDIVQLDQAADDLDARWRKRGRGD